MTFWKRLRRLGQILFLAVAAATLSAAYVLGPEDPPPPSSRTVPGLDGAKGTSGL